MAGIVISWTKNQVKDFPLDVRYLVVDCTWSFVMNLLNNSIYNKVVKIIAKQKPLEDYYVIVITI